MAEDVERRLEVRITVSPVLPEIMAWEMLLGSIVEVGGQDVTLAMTVVGIGAPAGSVHPFLAIAGSVDVDADHKGVGNGMADTARNSVYAPAAFLQGSAISLVSDVSAVSGGLHRRR